MTQNQMRVLRVLGGSDGSRRNCTIYTFSWFKSLAVLFPINEEPKIHPKGSLPTGSTMDLDPKSVKRIESMTSQ